MEKRVKWSVSLTSNAYYCRSYDDPGKRVHESNPPSEKNSTVQFFCGLKRRGKDVAWDSWAMGGHGDNIYGFPLSSGSTSESVPRYFNSIFYSSFPPAHRSNHLQRTIPPTIKPVLSLGSSIPPKLRAPRKPTLVIISFSCSIGHPPHSLASPVELRLRVGPRALSGKKKELGNKG